MDIQYGKSKDEKDAYIKGRKDAVKKTIKEMHDKFHPQIYFLTQSSATGAGYTIKEIYKEAWPDEPMPKIAFIDAKDTKLEMRYNENFKTNEDLSLKELVRKTKAQLSKYKVNGNIAVIDEFEGEAPGHNTNEIVHLKSKSLEASRIAIEEAEKELGLNGKVVEGGFGDGFRKFHGYWIRPDGTGIDGRSDTPRLATRGGIKPRLDPYVSKVLYENGEEKEFERASENVKRLKELGREIGEEIREEKQKKKKLEEIITGIISIGCLGLGILFLSMNVTGNVIRNITNSSSSFFGAGFLIIGLITGFFWIKRK